MVCESVRDYEYQQQIEEQKRRDRERKRKQRKLKSKKIILDEAKKNGWSLTPKSNWKFTATKPYSNDKMEIEILDSGTIRITTDGKISAANHMSAENFHRCIQFAVGGKVTVQQKPGTVAHAHAGQLPHIHT